MSINKALIFLLDASMKLHRDALRTTADMRKLAYIADVLGKPVRDVRGGVQSHATDGGGVRPWLTDYFVVTVEGITVFRGALTTVPEALWPEAVRDAYSRHTQRRELRTAKDAKP